MEKEKPYGPLLHRELHIHDVETNFAAQIELLRDVVNYGTNLIPSCYGSSEKNLSAVVVIAVLLKQVVSMLDALEVLVSNACVPAALLQMRALFEASVQIDFILQGQEEAKARCFYVANVRKELMWALRSQKKDPEHEQFFATLGEFGKALEETQKKVADPSKHQVEAINEFLSKEPWAATNAELLKARGKRKHDVEWYVPFGSGSVRNLSEKTGRLHEYEIFYSMSSEKMHGSDYKSHIALGAGQVKFKPIRNLEECHTVLNFGLSVALSTYRKVLERYRPGQLTEFAKRHIEHWRQPFLNIPTIKYKSSSE